jgi:hypothetical protein
MSTPEGGGPGDEMTDTGANVVIAYSRFREIQDRRRAITAALRRPDQLPATAADVVHVEATVASPRPLNRKPC